MLYTLKLYSAECQLYLNKTWKKIKISKQDKKEANVLQTMPCIVQPVLLIFLMIKWFTKLHVQSILLIVLAKNQCKNTP